MTVKGDIMRVKVGREWQRSIAVGIISALTLVSAGAVTAAPARAATGYSYLWIDGEAGDLFFPGNATYAAQLSPGSAYVDAQWGGFRWRADLRAPAGERLTAGTTYTDVQRAPTATAPHAGLEVASEFSECTTVSGSFTILELQLDASSGEVVGFAASFEQRCQGAPGVTHGLVGYNATRTPTRFEEMTIDHAAPTTEVAIVGDLIDAAGLVTSVAVAVSRPDGSGGTTVLPTTFDEQGLWRAQDTMPTTNTIYTVSFAGDTNRLPSSMAIAVTAVKQDTYLSIGSPTTTARGKAYSVHGTLSVDGAKRAGASITLTRRDTAGTRVRTVLTDSTGAYNYVDTPAVGGKVTWTASWPGTPAAMADTITRTTTVTRTPTSISLSTDRSVYAYGAMARIKVHLGSTYNSRVVSIYAKKYGAASPTLVAKGTVNASGYLTATYRVTVKTLFTARFNGDYRHDASTSSSWRTSHRKIALSLYGYRSKSGTTYTYAVGKNPLGITRMLPAHKNSLLEIRLDRWTGRSWSTLVSQGETPDPDGSYAFAIGSPARPTTLRLRFTTAADTYNASGTYGWIYLRFV